jgi:hypothetical protein
MPWGSSAAKSGDESAGDVKKPKKKFNLGKSIRFSPSTVGGSGSVVETTTEEITSVEPIAQKQKKEKKKKGEASGDGKASPWEKLKGMTQKKEKVAAAAEE